MHTGTVIIDFPQHQLYDYLGAVMDVHALLPHLHPTDGPSSTGMLVTPAGITTRALCLRSRCRPLGCMYPACSALTQATAPLRSLTT
eukprot:356977-Amphidinium_carterae.1